MNPNIHFPADKTLFNARFFYIVFANAFIFSLLSFNTNFNEFFNDFLTSFIFSFSIYFTLLFFISFLGKKCFTIAQNFLFFIHFFVLTINLFLIFNFNATLTNTTFEIFLSTNQRELKEFIEFYATAENIFLFVFCFLTGGLFFKIKTTFFCPPFLSVVFVALFAFILSYYHISSTLDKNLEKISLYHIFQILKKQTNKETGHLQIVQNFHKTLNENLKNKKDYIQFKKETPIFPKIVLILGESIQRNYMSLYGFPIETTPELKKLEKENQLFVFKDVISPNTNTHQSLSQVLTFANQKNQKLWHKEMNLIDSMKLLNYHTLWFSNQDADAGNIFGNLANALSRRAHIVQYSAFLSSVEMMKNKSPKDEIVLKLYRNTPPPSQNQFIVFHLMGAHYLYQHRYPQSFQKFTPDDLIQKNVNTTFYKNTKSFKQELNSKQLKMRADYLNAVYYHDNVISKIIQLFEKEESIVFYLSDHAQEVFDDANRMAGHGSSQFPSRPMVEIPFFIYMNKISQEKHPEIVFKIKKALNQAFMTDDFMHAFFDLLNIECKELEPSLSLFNETYQPKDRLIGKSLRNYDQVFIRQELEKHPR